MAWGPTGGLVSSAFRLAAADDYAVDNSERRLAAFHESGHAAAMKEVGALNGDVWIGSHGAGWTTERRNVAWNLFVGEFRTRSDALLIGIAGCLVEARYRDDEATLEELLAGQTDGERVREYLKGDSLSYWARRTEDLIDGYEDRIEALARELLASDSGLVDGVTARAILNERA